jgi:hypothetical protein
MLTQGMQLTQFSPDDSLLVTEHPPQVQVPGLDSEVTSETDAGPKASPCCVHGPCQARANFGQLTLARDMPALLWLLDEFT